MIDASFTDYGGYLDVAMTVNLLLTNPDLT